MHPGAEQTGQATVPCDLAAVGSRHVVLARTFWSLAGLAALGALATGLWLEPAPGGTDTHRQLGLAACGFTARTGLPCPGCGATTSFALSVRGRLPAAIRAHGAGPPLALLCLVVMTYAPWGIARAHAPRRILVTRAAYLLAIMVVVAWLGTYAVRLYAWLAPGAG